MVCIAKPNREYHDLVQVIDEIAEAAVERNCDVVIGRVAAEMSKQSQQLYRLLDNSDRRTTLDDEGDWVGYEPIWVTWSLFATCMAIGAGLCWAFISWTM